MISSCIAARNRTMPLDQPATFMSSMVFAQDTHKEDRGPLLQQRLGGDALEVRLECYLNYSRRPSACDASETAGVKRRAWVVQYGVVQNIEEFRPELQFPALGDWNILLRRKIDVDRPWPAQ